ncbi:response regulator [Sphingomonas sp. S1-29]|uniref:response regulator n=1 Tax=Sphingomonas sp. S1-29 TaxID=2991074 RepID=UPI00223EF6C3|nr:response regulator [Sphingomonas sp. S1-29]UZK69354.1 response regulator [Sphingomonas sp. S1-29]
MHAFLVVAPEGRDGEVIAQLLRSAGLSCVLDRDGEALIAAVAAGDNEGAIVTDDALARIDPERLRQAIEQQPPWSDFPFILLSKRGGSRPGLRVNEELVNVTVLERPLHPASLVSAARALARARRRQRLAAEHLQERERARAELRRFADTLERKVAERTAELASANDRLTAEIAERERAEARLIQARKMEAIGQLTGGIAHDFNNLLTAVIGSLDLLLRRTDDEKVRRLARMALQAGERGASLTSQLLSFSRKQQLSPAPVQPNHVVAAMSEMLARVITDDVVVETALADDLWPALADPTQLEVMLLNLAINARDAMPDGGTLRIATRNVATVPAEVAGELAEGHYIAIAVSDTGTGMSEAVIARAFEPFFTTKEKGKGTGLGLAQIYGFARQSGGTVHIASEVGRGATVTLYLPRTHDLVAPAPRDTTRDSITAGNAHILVVDDDDEVRAIAAQMLGEIGYEVTACESARHALADFAGERFDMVLTDILMPGMNGLEFARRVRAIDPAMPILFASGYADMADTRSELTEETLIRKPYRLAELADRIADTLARAQGAARQQA